MAVSAALAAVLLTGLAGVPVGPIASSASVPAPLVGAHPLASTTPPGPTGAVGALNVTVYNPGANATGPYEQPVAINSSEFATLINSNWSNGLAFYSGNNTPIYAWIESGATNRSTSTLVWLRLDSIPARSGVNVTFFFWPKSAFNLSEDGYLGENPTLSPTYAEWDNGWRVFDTYQNFSGTALPNGTAPLGSWAGTVSNGLTVSASYGLGAIESTFAAPVTHPFALETEARMVGNESPLCLFVAAAPGFSGEYQFFPSAYGLEPGANGTSSAILRTSNATGAPRTTTPVAAAPVDFTQSYHVIGLTWFGSNATETGSVNGVPFVSQTNATVGPIAAFGLGERCGLNCSGWNVSWVRTRSIPNPMPLVEDDAFSPVGVAVLSSPSATDINHAVTFTCTSSATNVSAQYAWTFGDGSSAVGRVVAHAYRDPGIYGVGCSVTTAQGAEGASSVVVTVQPVPAILLLQALPSIFPLGQSLNLVTNISGGTGPFDFSYVGLPPGCPERNTATFSCLPGVTGTFAIEVIVEDAVHEQSTAWITISVTTPPAPASAAPFSPLEGYAIAGAVAGAVLLAGVVPVLLWNRRASEASAALGRPPARRRPDPDPQDLDPWELELDGDEGTGR